MADLTADIGLPEHPYGIRGAMEIKNPNPEIDHTQSLLGGLANLVDTGVKDVFGRDGDGGLGAGSANKKAEEWANNGVAQAAWSNFKATDGVGDSDISPHAASQIDSTVAGAANVQRGVQQGRTSQDAANLATQNAVDSLMQQHPDRAGYIMDAFKKYGLDTQLGRVRDLQQKQDDAEAVSRQKVDDDNFAEGAKWDPQYANKDRAVVIQSGAQIRYQEALDTKLKDDAAAFRDTTKFTQEQSDRLLKQNAKDAVTNESNRFSSMTAPIMDHIISLKGQVDATGDPEAVKQLGLLYPQLDGAIDHFANQSAINIRASGGGDEEVKNFQESVVAPLHALLKEQASGTFSEAQTNDRIIKTLTSTYGVKEAQALPTYFAVKKLGLTSDEMAKVFPTTGPSTLPPDVIQGMQKEFQGLSLGGADGHMAAYNILRVAKGQTNIKDLSPIDAQKAIPTLVTVTNQTADRIYNGDKDPVSYKSFLDSQGNVINAVHGLSVGHATPHDLITAVGVLDRTNNVAVMYRATNVSDTADQAIDTVQGFRGANAKLLAYLQHQPQESKPYSNIGARYEIGDGGQMVVDTTIKFDDKAGAYSTVSPNRNSRDALGNFKVDQTMVDQANAMNATLKALTESAKFDPAIPKNATPLSIRNFYANGTPFKDATGAVIQPPKQEQASSVTKDISDFSTSLAKESTEAAAGTANTAAALGEQTRVSERQKQYQPVVEAAADKYGVSKAGVVKLISEVENGKWDPSVTNTGKHGESHATGLGQLQPNLAIQYGYAKTHSEAMAVLHDPEKNADIQAHYLSDLHKQYGNWEDALNHYGGPHNYSYDTVKSLAKVFDAG